MKKILITGASGFVGTHVAAQARARGMDVYELSHRKVSLEDRAMLEKVLQEVKPEVVVHLATSTLMSGKTADSHTLLATNVEGAVNLMDASVSVGVQAFVNVGSFVEYGPKKHAAREDDTCEPVELYAVSKLAATLYGQGLARRTGFPCVTFRLFTPYGPGIQPGRLVRTVIEKVKAEEDLVLTKRTVGRDFVYVEDVPALFFEAIDKISQIKGEIFNLGTGLCTTLEKVVSTVEETLDKKAKPQWDVFPLQSYDSELWQADMKKTFFHFSWRSRTTFKEGIKKTIASMYT